MTGPTYTEPLAPAFNASPEDWQEYLRESLAWAFSDGDGQAIHYGGRASDLIGHRVVSRCTVRSWCARRWVEPGVRGVYRTAVLQLTDEGRAAIAASE